MISFPLLFSFFRSIFWEFCLHDIKYLNWELLHQKNGLCQDHQSSLALISAWASIDTLAPTDFLPTFVISVLFLQNLWFHITFRGYFLIIRCVLKSRKLFFTFRTTELNKLLNVHSDLKVILMVVHDNLYCLR